MLFLGQNLSCLCLCLPFLLAQIKTATPDVCTSKLERNYLQDMLQQLADTSDVKLLDLGAGRGDVTACIARQIPHGSVLGVDVLPSIVARAREHHGTLANLQFEQRDACDLGYVNQFDGIVSFSTFQWIKEKQLALHNCYDALKPGGLLLIVMGAALSVEHPFRKAFVQTLDVWSERLGPVDFDAQHFGSSVFHMNELLKKAGFQKNAVHTEDKMRWFANNEQLAVWMAGWSGAFPVLNVLTHIERLTFMRSVVDSYTQLVGYERGGGIMYKIPIFIIRAQRLES